MLAAAGFGQCISDSSGVLSAGGFDKMSSNVLPDTGLTESQLQLHSVWAVGVASEVIFVIIGCLLGMCPLLCMDTLVEPDFIVDSDKELVDAIGEKLDIINESEKVNMSDSQSN